MFGGLNALFSGLAFAGLIFAILLQKNELALQREELSLTREELKGQRQELSKQNKVYKIEMFDRTFFQMMELHNKLIESMTIFGLQDRTFKGRECFVGLHELLKDYYKKVDLNVYGVTRPDERKTCFYAFLHMHRDFDFAIGPYINSYEALLSLIYHSGIENKKPYYRIVNAYTSDHELAFFYYSLQMNISSCIYLKICTEYGWFNRLKSHKCPLLIAGFDHIDLLDKKLFDHILGAEDYPEFSKDMLHNQSFERSR